MKLTINLLIIIISCSCTINSHVMLKTKSDYVFDEIDYKNNPEYKIAANDIIDFRLYTNDGFEVIDMVSQSSSNSSILNQANIIQYNIRKDSLVNKLRLEFPVNNIFSIPTGQATFTLYQLQKDSLLLDDISYRGNRENSLFTDEKGHQGDIIINTGALMWLESIYSVDLDENDYETGFNTDLHSIAQDILDSYNQN